MLDKETLAQVLGTHPFRYYDQIASTNDEAVAWLKDGAPEGAIVIADEQLRGRGRLGRIWHTPKGVALAVSIVLKPLPQQASHLSLLGAVAVAELCESLEIAQVGIKWPNDVQIGGKKVCGILPEAVWQEDKLLGVVLGIGVNVHVSFDETLAQTAINLADATPQVLSRAGLIGRLLEKVLYWRSFLGDSLLLQAWQARLTTLGQQVRVGDVVGLAREVDVQGALWIETPQGKRERVIAGDIEIQ